VCLKRGTVATDDFSPEALADRDTLAVARRLVVIADGNPDPNALAPIRVELNLADAMTLACDVNEVIGSPARPLSTASARAKFESCCLSASPTAADQVAALWSAAMALETLDDVASVAPLTIPVDEPSVRHG